MSRIETVEFEAHRIHEQASRRGFASSVTLFFDTQGTLQFIETDGNPRISRALFDAMTEKVLSITKDKVATWEREQAEEITRIEEVSPKNPHFIKAIDGLKIECFACKKAETLARRILRESGTDYGDVPFEMQECPASPEEKAAVLADLHIKGYRQEKKLVSVRGGSAQVVATFFVQDRDPRLKEMRQKSLPTPENESDVE
ncbi:hypothetical protein [Myxococcus phage Mx1]|nr:hypothetical protein [Myxococcus phage Mx1]